jgi:hypothetical protein
MGFAYSFSMALHAALASAATLIAVAFALSTLERYLGRRKKHELMWTISLFMFAVGSFGLFLGASIGWSEWTFKVFYLFGAILNVPFLALGTVYLMCDERVADLCTVIVALLGAFAAGILVATPVIGLIEADQIPQGKVVFGIGPVILAGVGSGVASIVIIGGALWSAWRFWRLRRTPSSMRATGISPGRLALANVVIAVGTIVTGSGGILNSVADRMNAFSISLVAGIALIFAGFLLTNPPTPRPGEDHHDDVEPWFAEAALDPRDPESVDLRNAQPIASGSPQLN